MRIVSVSSRKRVQWDSAGLPLQDAPQTWQVKMAFCFPAPPSRRFPQSVQKTRDPIAAMLRDSWSGGVTF